MSISLIKEEEAHILRVLPVLLKRDTQFRDSLYGILSETFIKRDDFSELKGIVKELGIRVNELAKAQKKSEERLTRLETAVEELAKAQRETQKQVNEIAKAQKKSEERLTKVEITLSQLNKQVGSLSQSIGFGLEDIARVVLPGYLKRHLDIDVDNFERRFFFIDKKEIEVNLYAEGKQKGKEIIILGESKGRIYQREVEEFRDGINILKDVLQKPFIKLMFGFFIHPSGQEVASKEDIILIASYQR